MIEHLQHRFQSGVQTNAKPLQLTKGQMFHGRILKLYPNGTAALSINGTQVMAQLETALAAGERYWFEVESESPIPRLKILQPNGQKGPEPPSQFQQLAEQLSLQKSRQMETLFNRLMEQQIPFSRNSLMQLNALMKQIGKPTAEQLNTLALMMQRGLPVTEDVFLALQSVRTEPSLRDVLQRLFIQIQQDELPGNDHLRQLLATILQKNGSPERAPLSQLFSLLSQFEEGSEEGNAIKQLFIRLGVMQQGMTNDQLQQSLKNEMLKVYPQLKNSQLANFNLAQLAQLGEEQLKSLVLPRGMQQVESLLKSPLSKMESAMLQRVLTTGEPPFAHHLKSMLAMLGYDYENELGRFLQGDLSKDQLMQDRLKAQLLQLKQQDLPSALKEQLTQAIHRLTGQQLLAQEHVGVHQLTMQIPLNLGAFQTEMTLQMEGKKNENNELDPEYCRILFYLTLERLQEVVVDVQIQNRIVTIAVYNEQEKPSALIETFLPILKEKLNEQNYKLLSLKWEKEKTQNHSVRTADPPYTQKISYEGVDVRI